MGVMLYRVTRRIDNTPQLNKNPMGHETGGGWKARSPGPQPQPQQQLLLLLLLLGGGGFGAWRANALIHELKVSGDNRRVFHIESFGFAAGGVADLSVKSFGIWPIPKESASWNMGFVFRKVVSESDAVASIDEAIQSGSCLLDIGDETNKDDSKMLDDVKWLAPKDVSTWSNGWDHNHVIQADEDGMYQLIFERCYPADTETTVSFDINVTMYNVNALTGKRDYLSAGDSALPLIFFISTATFGFIGMFWLYICHKNKEFVHHVHVLMLILIGLKMMASLFRGISYYSLQLYGYSVGWNVIFYIFTFLRGTMLFSVIMLVGTGWSLLKPYLNEREKRILLTVLPLQVIDNIALVAIEEMSPGSRAWLTWRDALHIVDIICCCLILFPLVWQIRRLRLSAVADKSLSDLDKLTRYRNFYMAVVGYIYFTRIIVYLLGATVPFTLTWLKAFSGEAATVAFFCWTGWKFRPMSDNPYLPVQLEEDDEYGDDDLDEYGLDDDLDIAEGGGKLGLGAEMRAPNSAEERGAEGDEKKGVEMVSKKKRSNTTLRMMSEDFDGRECEVSEEETEV